MLRRLIRIALGLATLTLVVLTITTHYAIRHHPLVGDWVRSSTFMTLQPDGTGITRYTREQPISLLWDAQPGNRLLLINHAAAGVDPAIMEETWQIIGDELRLINPTHGTMRWIRWQPAPPLDDPAQIRQALLDHAWHMPWIDVDDTVMTFAADGTLSSRCTNDRCTQSTGHWTQEGSRIFVSMKSPTDHDLPPFELTFAGVRQFTMTHPSVPQPFYFHGRPRP